MKNQPHHITKNILGTGLAVAGLALLSACGPSEPAASVTAEAELSEGFLLASKPENALSVMEAREQLSPGDIAVIEGQIGGAKDPFFDGFAGFVLADREILFCDEIGGEEHCATPWDACCEDPDKLKAGRVSVQMVDAEGTPLEGNLGSGGGLAGLDHVIVSGTVGEGSTAENLIIDAQGYYLVE